jgi:hypothetical protein
VENKIKELVQKADQTITKYWDRETIDIDVANEVVTLLGQATAMLEQLQKPEIGTYTAPETTTYDQTHTVRLTFMFDDAIAIVESEMGGNVNGGGVLESFTEFDCGFSAIRNEENERYVQFVDDDDKPHGEVSGIIMRYPNGAVFEVDVEDAHEYLVKLEIVKYQP